MSKIKKMGKLFRSMILLISLLLGSFPIDPTMVLAETPGNDVTSFLSNLELEVTQGGLLIAEGGEFSTDPISVKISFGVPVIGDFPEPTDVVNQGDYAIFKIEGFSLIGGPQTTNLIYNGVKLGTLEFSSVDEGKSAQLKIIFDGEEDVFNGNFSEVSAMFSANLEYVGNEQGTEDEAYTVTILGKTFTVNVPAIPKEYSGDKTGVKRGDEIDWTIKIEAKQGEQNLSLSGFKLFDDLINVGELVNVDPAVYDFYYNTTNDVTTATKFDPTLVVRDGSKYTMEFPVGAIAPMYVFFSTKIQEDFVTNGTKTITNVARLLEGEVERVVVSDSVSFENRWIEKTAGSTVYETEIIDGVEKRVAYITWFITVNHMGASLSNARIIDILDSKLLFVESEWYRKSGETWTSVDGVNTTRPVGDTYFYPEPVLNENVQLRIKTKVNPDENIGHKVISISNSARLEWDNGPGAGIGSGSINVGVGTNPINKTVGNYDVKNHTIPWTVTVVESDVSVDLRVLDLLVYGSSFNYSDVASVELISGSGVGLENMDKAKLDLLQSSLVPSVRQKFKPDSFLSASGLTHSVYALKNSDGVVIADLVVVSQGGSTIDLSGGSKSFRFDTIVTDPAWYLSNTNRNVVNTAMLYSANNKLNQRSATRSIAPRAVFKDMLKANASVDPETNKNDRTTNINEGFNYEDKSVVFRLFVNQNGINATGGITTTDGQFLGDVTVVDSLPPGWEFVDIEDGIKFYLFKASGNPTSMTVGDRIPVYDDILTANFDTAGRATFVFSKLEEPYVIFVKAKPTEATVNGYFNDNKTTTVTNTLNLTADYGVTASNTQQVRITSQILDKTMAKVENGILRWTISYRPYDIFQNVQVLDQYRLIDTLPMGLELFTDSLGNLDFTQDNFVVTEMELTPSGYVASGQIFTLEQLQASISYDSVNRRLIFTLPNRDMSYKFDYKTMVTASSGSLTNSVVLEGVSLTTNNTSSSYSVASADASATMTRNGWVEVNKVNQNRVQLAGSEFTVFTEDKSVAFRIGVTDSQGKVVIRGLPVGDYILMETKAPVGYTVSEREYRVTVRSESGTIITSIDGKTGADSNKISVTNYQLGTSGDITVSKRVTGNDADELRAFEFTLSIVGVVGEKNFTKTSADGILSYGSVIFTNGVASFSLRHNESITIVGLPKDANYTLEEEAADYEASFTVNSGTVIEGHVYSGVVAVDSEDKVDFTNHRDSFAFIVIEKADALTGQSISGTRFNLYDADMNFFAEFPATSSEGLTRIDRIPVGKYFIVEVQASEGYILNATPVEILPIRNVETNVQIENQPYRSIRLVKVDALDSSKLLERVPFVLRNASGAIVDAKVTDVNGEIVFGELPFGVYTLEELSPLPNYQALAQPIEVIVNDSSPLVTLVNVSNFPQGEISIIKTDEDSKLPLEGVEFSLYSEANELIASRLTDQNGFVHFGQFNFGKYYVLETQPLLGYVPNSTRYEVDFSTQTSNIFTFTVANYQYREILVTKVDGYSLEPVEGVEFTLYNSDEEVVGVAETNEAGVVKFDGLVYGNYVLKETRTADNYMIDESSYEFEFNPEESITQEITIENDRFRSIEVVKVDAFSKEPLMGVTFDLYQAELLLDSKVTDEQGKVVFDGLNFGDYIVVEREPLAGYMQLEEDVMIAFEENGNPEQVVVVENDRYRSIEVVKVDAFSDEPLMGVTFDLYQGELLLDSKVTDEQGKVVFDGLDFGDYIVVEREPLAGYMPLEEGVMIAFEENGNPEQVVVVENDQYRRLEVYKVDAYTGSPLDGVTFDLYQDEQLLDSKVTDEQGKVVFEGLNFGDYIIVEREPLAGYMPLEEDVMIAFEENGNPEQVVVVENDQYRSVEVTKKDSESDKVLEGVEFELYLGDELVGTAVTDENGIVQFSGLVFGTYRLVESKPLLGYLPLEGEVEILVDQSELVVRLTVSNEIDPDYIFGDGDDNLPDTSNRQYPYGAWLMILGLFLILVSLMKAPLPSKKH